MAGAVNLRAGLATAASRRIETSEPSGLHATAVRALILASRRRDAWLGGATDGDSSFPYTDVEHLHAHRVFLAALTFLSCVTPHALHTHVLTESMSKPVGPVWA